MTTCGHEHEDGAYVLGALSPEDRVAFERHLPGCPECAQSVRELAGLPGLLARVPIEILDPEKLPMPVPDTLLPALVRRVRRSQRRRTWITAGLVAAAAAIAIGAVGVSDALRRRRLAAARRSAPRQVAHAQPGPTTAAPVQMTPVGAEPISGWLSLTQVGWGTRLDLTCSYAQESECLPGPEVVDVHDVRAAPPTAAPSGSRPGRRCPARRCGSRRRQPPMSTTSPTSKSARPRRHRPRARLTQPRLRGFEQALARLLNHPRRDRWLRSSRWRASRTLAT